MKTQVIMTHVCLLSMAMHASEGSLCGRMHAGLLGKRMLLTAVHATH